MTEFTQTLIFSAFAISLAYFGYWYTFIYTNRDILRDHKAHRKKVIKAIKKDTHREE